jgi:hypothetical protein
LAKLAERILGAIRYMISNPLEKYRILTVNECRTLIILDSFVRGACFPS